MAPASANSEPQSPHDSESRARAFIEGSTPEQKAVREQLRRSRPVSEPQSPQREPVAGDLSAGLDELADLIYFQVSAWQEFGYAQPPTPECATIPPLGERSAKAIKAGHEAIETIDELIRRLHLLRGQLVNELRKDADIRGARVDRLLADRQTATGDGAR